MEICDPCQGPLFAYQVDHNHPAAVSDFCMPSFYGLGNAGPPYSKRGNVSTAFSVEDGGVLSFQVANQDWFQLQAIGGPTRIVQVDQGALLGALGDDHNFRGTLDRLGRTYGGPPVLKARSRGARKYIEIQKLARARAQQEVDLLTARLNALGM